jgi:hypothetical protein
MDPLAELSQEQCAWVIEHEASGVARRRFVEKHPGLGRRGGTLSPVGADLHVSVLVDAVVVERNREGRLGERAEQYVRNPLVEIEVDLIDLWTRVEESAVCYA